MYNIVVLYPKDDRPSEELAEALRDDMFIPESTVAISASSLKECIQVKIDGRLSVIERWRRDTERDSRWVDSMVIKISDDVFDDVKSMMTRGSFKRR